MKNKYLNAIYPIALALCFASPVPAADEEIKLDWTDTKAQMLKHLTSTEEAKQMKAAMDAIRKMLDKKDRKALHDLLVERVALEKDYKAAREKKADTDFYFEKLAQLGEKGGDAFLEILKNSKPFKVLGHSRDNKTFVGEVKAPRRFFDSSGLLVVVAQFENRDYLLEFDLGHYTPEIYVGVSLKAEKSLERKEIQVTLSDAFKSPEGKRLLLPNRKEAFEGEKDRKPFGADMRLQGDLESDTYAFNLGAHPASRNRREDMELMTRNYRRYAFELAFGAYLSTNLGISGGKVTIPEAEFERRTKVSFKKEEEK